MGRHKCCFSMRPVKNGLTRSLNHLNHCTEAGCYCSSGAPHFFRFNHIDPVIYFTYRVRFLNIVL